MKKGKLIKYYAIITQGIITMIVLLFLGFLIGTRIDKDSAWPGILATFGAICGVIYLIKLVLMIGGETNE